MHVAVRNIQKETTELLIQLGIDVNVRNKNSETPLHIAVSIKDQDKAVEIIEVMLLKGGNPRLKDILGDSPIEKAKRQGKSNVLVLFSSLSDERGATPSLSFRM